MCSTKIHFGLVLSSPTEADQEAKGTAENVKGSAQFKEGTGRGKDQANPGREKQRERDG